MLKNILLKHFVIVDFEFVTGTKKVGEVEKPSTKLKIKQNGITSDEFTYKANEGGEYTLQARSDRYLEDIAKILVYPTEEYNITSLIGETKTREKEKTTPNRGGKTYSGKRKDKQRDENREEFEKHSRETRNIDVGSGIMEEALKNLKL